VHALEFYHLFSHWGLWGAHTALCTWKSMWSDRSSQPASLLTRQVGLTGQIQGTHLHWRTQ
jgi:hypothetical protein